MGHHSPPLAPARRRCLRGSSFSSGLSSRLFSGRTARGHEADASPRYVVSEEQKKSFAEKGYALLPKFLSEEELKPIEEIYDRFMSREIKVPGKDFCDMSKSFDTAFEDFSIVNCMLPRVYYPPLQGNIYEILAESVAAQLFEGLEMRLDYDQLLNKRPGKQDAVFAWHQDMAYWPPREVTPDTRTVTFSLALDATTKANGCLVFLPGSGLEGELRPHVPIGSSRDDSHAIAVQVSDEEYQEHVQAERGDVTIHDEWVVHGSQGNLTDGNRRTYVVAYRARDTVERERALGFTHSHNTEFSWDAWIDGWDEAKEAALLEKIGQKKGRE